MKKAKIISTGSYLPEKVLTNTDLEKMVDTSDEWITQRTGIKRRHIASKEEATSDMVIEASKKALGRINMEPDELDAIIIANITPDTLFPSTGCWVQKELGMEKEVPAFDISAACSGFIYGLIVADSLIKSGMFKRILVAGAEQLTKITNWEDRNTCVLFGDGAGVAIVEESNDDSGILSSYWGANGNLGDLLIQPAGGSRLPASEETVKKKLHTVHMEGRKVFRWATRYMSQSAKEVLKRANFEGKDVDLFIPHQANVRIMEQARKQAKISPEKTYMIIDEIGNVSAATVPIALDKAYDEGRINKGDIIVLDAFGGGFTWGAVLLRW